VHIHAEIRPITRSMGGPTAGGRSLDIYSKCGASNTKSTVGNGRLSPVGDGDDKLGGVGLDDDNTFPGRTATSRSPLYPRMPSVPIPNNAQAPMKTMAAPRLLARGLLPWLPSSLESQVCSPRESREGRLARCKGRPRVDGSKSSVVDVICSAAGIDEDGIAWRLLERLWLARG
jgi:hypothetical protein